MIKGGCQLGRKAVSHNSKSDLPLMGKKDDFLIFNNLYLFLKCHAPVRQVQLGKVASYNVTTVFTL